MRPYVTLVLVARARWLSLFASRSRFTRRPTLAVTKNVAVHACDQVADSPPGVEPAVEPLKHRRHVGGGDARERNEFESGEHQRGSSSAVTRPGIWGQTCVGHSIT